MRRRTAELVAAHLLTETQSAGGEDEVVRLETRARCGRAIEAAVAEMPPDEARFAHLFYREELGRNKIAQRLDVSPRTVQCLHNRGEVKLVLALDAEMLHDE